MMIRSGFSNVVVSKCGMKRVLMLEKSKMAEYEMIHEVFQVSEDN